MIKALAHITKHIKEYREANVLDGEALNIHLQQIMATLYYLETVRSDIHKQWQSTVYKLVENGQSVSRAENQAHVQHPEMYQLRHIMDSSYRVCDAIRSHLSWLKSERINSNG